VTLKDTKNFYTFTLLFYQNQNCMNYSEKLKLPEWKRKRKAILLRDNYRCQNCGLKKKQNWVDNDYILSIPINQTNLVIDEIEPVWNDGFNSYEIKSANKEYILNSIPNYNERLDNTQDLILITHKKSKKYKKKSKSLSNFIATNSSSELSQSKTNRNITRIKKNKIKLLDNTLKSFHPVLTFISNESGLDYLTNTQLNVHHKKYKVRGKYESGADPWDYNNEDLVTLCTHCHMLVHLEFNMPLYYNGKVKYFMEQCTRCSGEGILPQYAHVRNGECFRCNGVGFEPYNDYFKLFR